MLVKSFRAAALVNILKPHCDSWKRSYQIKLIHINIWDEQHILLFLFPIRYTPLFGKKEFLLFYVDSRLTNQGFV